jgi:hypothetical protein
MKHLIDYYKEWCVKGEMPKEGLCASLEDLNASDLLNLFQPDQLEELELMDEGISTTFWGNDRPYGYPLEFEIRKRFNPFRQTIVLLICAMRDEL